MQPVNFGDKASVGIITSVHHPLDGRIFYKQAASLKKAGYNVELLCYSVKDLHEEQEIEGIKIFPIKKIGASRIFRFIGLFSFIKVALRRHYSIIHIHDPELLLVALFIKVIAGSKIIYDIHEDYESAILDRTWIPAGLRTLVSICFRYTESIIIKGFDALLPTTSQIADKYRHPRVTVIYNYPPKEQYVIHKRLNEKGPYQLIYVGGINEARGIYETLNALEFLKNYTKEFKVLFLGDFDNQSLEETVKLLVYQKGLEGHIEFKTKILYNEIFMHLAQSSVGLLPYLRRPNHFTTLPNKLFEYMATGNAVVANNLPQYEEIVTKYRCGLTVDVTDRKAYAEAMYKLIGDSKWFQTIRENAYTAYNEHCNWNSEEKKLLKLYEEVRED